LQAVSTSCALQLTELWKQQQHAQLLQSPLGNSSRSSVASNAIKQTALLARALYDAAAECTDTGSDAHAGEFLQATSTHKVITLLAHLALWLQEAPALLDIPGVAAAGADYCQLPLTAPGRLWLQCVRCLELFGSLALQASSAVIEGRWQVQVLQELGVAPGELMLMLKNTAACAVYP
jgi:hypothetical protein